MTSSNRKIRDYFWYLLSILFRYFPIRYPTGLIKVGTPGADSPVFVSGNYHYTVFKLLGILRKQNCYVLIADSAGINVWCAAGAGDFNENKISDAIQTYKLHEVVNHSRIILPQLSAVGVDLNNLKKNSGFTGKWGPASYYDLPNYIDSNYVTQTNQRKLKVPFRDNLELSLGIFIAYVMSYLPYYLLYACFFGNDYNQIVMIATFLVFINFFITAFLDYSPFKWPSHNVLFLGLPIWGFIILLYLKGVISGSLFILSITINFIVTILVCVDMQGSTIHFKSSFLSWLKSFNTRSQFQPTLNKSSCVQCGKCLNVCPKNMIELKDRFPDFNLSLECCECLACVKQCAYNAINNLNRGHYKKDIKSISIEVLDKIM